MRISQAARVLVPLALAVPCTAQAFDPTPQPIDASFAAKQFAVLDVDNDGDPDVAVSTGSQLRLLENFGGGQFAAWPDLDAFPANLLDVQTGDIDGDGWTDVLIGQGTHIKWYRNLAGAGFGIAKVVTNWAGTAEEVALADMDGDGRLDVVARMDLPPRIQWFKHNGTFGPTGPALDVQPYFSPNFSILDMSVADVDNDGLDDVVYSSVSQFPNQRGIHVRLNQGGGAFLDASASFVHPGTVNNHWVDALDVDGDGDCDVIASLGLLVPWINIGGQIFTPQLAGPYDFLDEPFGETRETVLADLTGNGRLDVLAHNATLHALTWRSNRGLATGLSRAHPVAGLTTAPELATFRQASAADVDGDGDQDILFSSNAGLFWIASRLTGDCDGNGVPDNIDVMQAASADCNGNFVPDACDLQRESNDVDGDGLHDDCVPPAMSSIATTTTFVQAGPTLLLDDHTLSVQPGLLPVQRFHLRCPFPDDDYIILGSLSGTTPGIPLGVGVLPLAFDHYFQLLLADQSDFALALQEGSFKEAAPGEGVAWAYLLLATLPPGPSLAGLTAHHAFVAYDPETLAIDFVSNSVPTYLVP